MRYDLTRSHSDVRAAPSISVKEHDRDQGTFQATVSGTGAVSATVVIEASNDPDVLGWVALGTIALSGTTTATDGFTSDARWHYLRANVTAISGTEAVVNVIMGA